MIEENVKIIHQGFTPGRFEWIDSTLVTALRNGHWLMITHANFCRLDTVQYMIVLRFHSLHSLFFM